MGCGWLACLSCLIFSSFFFEGIVEVCLPSTSKQEEPADMFMVCVCGLLASLVSSSLLFFEGIVKACLPSTSEQEEPADIFYDARVACLLLLSHLLFFSLSV